MDTDPAVPRKAADRWVFRLSIEPVGDEGEAQVIDPIVRPVAGIDDARSRRVYVW